MATLGAGMLVKQTGLAKFAGEGYLEWADAMQAVLLEKELWESVRDDPATRPSGGAELAAFNQKKTRAFGLLKLGLETNVL